MTVHQVYESLMPPSPARLPIFSLLALSATAFLTILTETMPAAVLLQMTSDLNRTQAQIGALVGAYAIGAAIAAIPVIALTRSLPRRLLFLMALWVFCLSNLTTALSGNYQVIVAARFLAGVTSGIVWPMVAGYAVRLADSTTIGRAISIALSGSAVAMAIGLPIGNFLGTWMGWRASFGLLAAMALLLGVWIRLTIPVAPGMARNTRKPVLHVALIPDLPMILTLCGVAIFGHYALYTYISPLAEGMVLTGGPSTALLLFGTGALFGVALAGRLVDSHLRVFALSSFALTLMSMVSAMLAGPDTTLGALSILAWGLSFGGLPTVIQTASSRIAGSESELATAMIATVYNSGIFLGATIGGLTLTTFGFKGLLWTVEATMFLSLFLVCIGKNKAFPARPFK